MSNKGGRLGKETQTTGLPVTAQRILSDPEVTALIYGEVDHGHNAFLREFASEKHLDTLKQHGVIAIAVELPKSYQWVVDSLSLGYSRADFTGFFKYAFTFRDSNMRPLDEETSEERRNLLADLVERSRDREMQVMFIDQMTTLSRSMNDFLSGNAPMYQKIFAAVCSVP
jgi:hypothetical protein